jgi:hypothetical protein
MTSPQSQGGSYSLYLDGLIFWLVLIGGIIVLVKCFGNKSSISPVVAAGEATAAAAFAAWSPLP